MDLMDDDPDIRARLSIRFKFASIWRYGYPDTPIAGWFRVENPN